MYVLYVYFGILLDLFLLIVESSFQDKTATKKKTEI